jgi:hypothetical protein
MSLNDCLTKMKSNSTKNICCRYKFNPFRVAAVILFANPELHSGLLKFKPFGLTNIGCFLNLFVK